MQLSPRLDSVAKGPPDSPFAVYHSHESRSSLPGAQQPCRSTVTYAIGAEVCTKAESGLSSLFSDIERSVRQPNAPSDVPLTLVPKFQDFGLTTGSFMGHNRELLIVIEWTGIDRNGKLAWVQTARGSATGEAGNTRWSAKKNNEKIVADAVDDVFQKTRDLNAGSPELRKLGDSK